MKPYNLSDAFVALGRYYLNRPALISGKRQLSFAELPLAAAQVAHALRTRGIEPGQNVGLALRDSFDTTVYLIALWMIDAIGVVVDFRSPAAERAALADEFDLVALVSDNGVAAVSDTCITVDDNWLETVARQPETPPVSPGLESGTAVISLTSGTTGRPLGLLVTHDDPFTRALQNPFGTVDPGVYLCAQPMHFNSGRSNVVNRLLSGWTVIIHPPLFSPQELAETILRHNVDAMIGVPTVLRGLLGITKGRTTPLFPNMQRLQSGGAPMQPHEKIQICEQLNPHFREVYASSLCGNITSLSGADMRARPETVGRAGPLARLEIVDEADQLLPAGVPGNIRARTPSMISRTYKDRTRPQGDRLKDGWVYPGDIGLLDDEGFLRIVGRSSDMIIRGGANVHPSEIESVLSTLPGVTGVAVVGYASEREGEEIAAFVVADASVTEASLTVAARTLLSPDKRPRRIIRLEAFPQTSVGKLDRKALREMLLQQAPADESHRE